MATTYGGQETTIELSGISTCLDDRMLTNMFRTYGPIVRVTHNGSNSAQVVFAQKSHARKAVEATNGAVVYGKTLKAKLQRQFKNVNQPCRGFAAGICRKGDMCKYQHVTDDALFAPPTAPPTVKKAKREPKKKAPKDAPEPAVVPPEIQAIPGTQVCRHFSRGYCSQGAECKFAHVLGLPKPDTAASTEKTNRPCLFYQSGVCTRGDACRFVHEPKSSAAPVKIAANIAPVKNAPAKKTPAKKAAAKASSNDEDEAEPQQNDETRTCVECEKPGVAVWKCAKCDNSLYCDDCNSAVHRARVMAKHKRSKLPPVPKLPRCGECEAKTASVRCEQCEVPFCASCDASVHKFKSLRKHVRVKVSAKSEKAKPKLKEEPRPAKKEEKKQTVEPARLPKVENHVSYVESIPQLAFSSDSESEDEEMPEASPAQPRNEDEPMPAVTGSPDSETDDDFDDVKPQSSASIPDTQTRVAQEQTSESDLDDDFDDKPASKPTPVPASVPKTELSSDSDSSDDEAPEPTPAANPVPKMELSSDSESEDDSEDEAPAKPASKPASTPASKPTLAELSSESEEDSDGEALSKQAVKSTPKPASKSAAKTKPTPAPKPATKKALSKSSSSDSSSSDSSDSEDEAPPTKPAVKSTPAPRRAPAPARNNKAAGISEGSSHTLVKKIEAFNVSGEGDQLHLDANLNGFERLLAHDCAERLGLAHESTGAGLERHIIISRHGSKRPSADSNIGHKAKKSKHQHH